MNDSFLRKTILLLSRLFGKSVMVTLNVFHSCVLCWFLLDHRPPLYVKITYLPELVYRRLCNCIFFFTFHNRQTQVHSSNSHTHTHVHFIYLLECCVIQIWDNFFIDLYIRAVKLLLRV